MIKFLEEEMFNEYNNKNLIWYYMTFDENERFLHKIDWHLYMLQNDENMPFFSWFSIYCVENKIKNPFFEETIC